MGAVRAIGDNSASAHPWRGVVRSPWLAERLAALRATPGADALERFWGEVADRGTPIIEPDPERADGVRATFFWRWSGTGDELPVTLAGGIVISDFDHYVFAHEEDTDILHLTLQLPRGLRTSYLLAIGDSLAPFDPFAALGTRADRWQVDPLARQRWEALPIGPHPRTPAPAFSVVEIDAAPLRWGRRPQHPGTPAPETIVVHSDALGEDRRVWVWRSAEDDSARRSDADRCRLWVLDGWDAVHLQPVPSLLERWRAEGGPPVEAVFIDSGSSAQRQRDLLFRDEFVSFVCEEVAPIIDQRWGVTDRHSTAVTGMSAGGGMALYLGLRHPELFGAVVAQSSACAYFPPGSSSGWLAEQFAASPPTSTVFSLSAGAIEVDHVLEIPTLRDANAHFADLLRSLGCEVAFDELTCGHDLLPYRDHLVAALAGVWRDRGRPVP